ncbi:MAG: 1-deoxy-D-xylulose-5-phosphate reductoisomerase [Dehalococcoidia bacterium]|nr:1-deoxy-D-xylulose-5-phosphate reductoisomerase [Dehalococcoidia bacterium]MDW8119738.1 1-deoxy-D-xylulose-5-phosphate reductoisomerase [Chloroflexota bacterium]
MKGIVILGSTGSIGQQTLEILRTFPHEFQVRGLAANSNRDLLVRQAWETRPQAVWCGESLPKDILPPGTACVDALDALVDLPDVHLVVVATVGLSGLKPTLSSIRRGIPVALANKETIVAAGGFVMAEASRYQTPILPIDSEPSAIWQCLVGEEQTPTRLILTASGGALRTRPLHELPSVTPEEALRHPTWKMGKKITIDSATLMNKAFEVIEAHWLFGMPWERIEVVVHPQSIVHSMVEFPDGSIKAQLGVPDMRLPIQYALFYPRRMPNAAIPRLDFRTALTLVFEPLDTARYPCFSLALEAAKRGGSYPAVLNGADEAAVDLFLQRRIAFTDIPRLVGHALEAHSPVSNPTVDDLLQADAWARREVHRVVGAQMPWVSQ